MERHTLSRSAAAVLLLLVGGVCAPGWAAAGPRLQVRPQKMDYGAIRQGEQTRKVFLLRNAGDEALVIGQMRPSCAECMVESEATRRLAPGEEVELPVTYRATAVPGKYTAHVTLHSNDAEEPLQRIYLEVEITPRGDHATAEFEPAEADLGLFLVGAPVRRVVRVRNTGSAPLRLDELAAGPLVSVKARPAGELGPGGRGDIVLEAEGAKAGILRSHVTIATNDPDRPTVTVPVYGYVASAEEVERLVRGVVIEPRASLRPVGAQAGAGRAAVRVTNGQEARVMVSEPGARVVLALEPGKSGTLEVAAEGGADGSRLLLEITLFGSADVPQPVEKKG